MLRRLGVALLVMGVHALVVPIGTQVTSSPDVALVASGIGCLIAVAILASCASLASRGTAPELRGWASIGTALLTWAFVLHAIQGFLMYGEFREGGIYGDWLSGLVTLAPLITLGGWLALVVGLSRSTRCPAWARDLEATVYAIGIAFFGLLAAYLHHDEIPRMTATADAIPWAIVFYLAPPMMLVPLLRRAARQVEAESASELASARVA